MSNAIPASSFRHLPASRAARRRRPTLVLDRGKTGRVHEAVLRVRRGPGGGRSAHPGQRPPPIGFLPDRLWAAKAPGPVVSHPVLNAVARPSRRCNQSVGVDVGRGARRLSASTRSTASPRRHGASPGPGPSRTATDSPTSRTRHNAGSVASRATGAKYDPKQWRRWRSPRRRTVDRTGPRPLRPRRQAEW